MFQEKVTDEACQQKEKLVATNNAIGSTYWVKNEREIPATDWDSLMVVTRSFVENAWSKISKVLMKEFSEECVKRNPFMPHKALVTFESGRFLNPFILNRKWCKVGLFQLKLERWSFEKHSRKEVIFGNGRWIKFKNLPFKFWKKNSFEAIGRYNRGLVSISSKTLNMLDISKAIIQVKKNLCGFLPSSVVVNDPRLGSFTIAAEEVVKVDRYHASRRIAIQIKLEIEFFSNSLDIERVQTILEDEGSALTETIIYTDSECHPSNSNKIIFQKEDMQPSSINGSLHADKADAIKENDFLKNGMQELSINGVTHADSNFINAPLDCRNNTSVISLKEKRNVFSFSLDSKKDEHLMQPRMFYYSRRCN